MNAQHLKFFNDNLKSLQKLAQVTARRWKLVFPGIDFEELYGDAMLGIVIALKKLDFQYPKPWAYIRQYCQAQVLLRVRREYALRQKDRRVFFSLPLDPLTLQKTIDLQGQDLWHTAPSSNQNMLRQLEFLCARLHCPNETLRSALLALQEGQALSTIARQLGLPRSRLLKQLQSYLEERQRLDKQKLFCLLHQKTPSGA